MARIYFYPNQTNSRSGGRRRGFVIESLKYKATVTENGAVLLGENFEVDGYAARIARVVTHIHSDHLIGFRMSRKNAKLVIATPPTIEALQVLGYRTPENKALPLEYNQTTKLENERITLIDSKHILGACQVLVETEDGGRVGYTSDFRLEGVRVMQDLDTLVIDATYGEPGMNRPFKKELPQLLTDLVLEELSYGKPVVILGFHGKLQEVMELLRKNGVEAPYIMPRRVYELTNIAVKYGMNIRDYHLESTSEAKEIIRTKWYVEFHHVNSRSKPASRGKTIVQLTGWLFNTPIKKIDSYYRRAYVVGFSDHADYEETLEYVRIAKPKLLIVDSYRASLRIAESFARSVENRIGVKTIVMPEKPFRAARSVD